MQETAAECINHSKHIQLDAAFKKIPPKDDLMQVMLLFAVRAVISVRRKKEPNNSAGLVPSNKELNYSPARPTDPSSVEGEGFFRPA